MRVVSFDEAKAILSESLVCEDCTDWTPWNLQPTSVVATAGIMKVDGSSARLIVELVFTRTHKVKQVQYRFTVFRREAWGLDPIYQLHIKQSSKKTDAHSLPHEHFGSRRIVGDASWSKWGYDEVLAYFSRATGINFSPSPPHPESFALKSD